MISLKNTGSGMSAAELNAMGAKNIGEVLNKIADPQWSDPSKKVRAVGDAKMDKDAFLKLMLTQLQNQDPTSPMESHDMAAQLAQFTSLEQLQNINTTLVDMKTAQKPSNDFQALQLIGKVVSGDSAKLSRAESDTDHDFIFELPENGKGIEIRVIGPHGETVRTYSMQNLEKGENKVTWNGQTEQGVKAGSGEYRFEIDAVGENDRKLAVDTNFEGKITGMNYTAAGPVLLIGNKSIKLRDVRRIIDPSIQQNGQNVKDVTAQDLSQGEKAAQNIGSEARTPVPSNMDQIGMDRGMQNKLQKLTK